MMRCSEQLHSVSGRLASYLDGIVWIGLVVLCIFSLRTPEVRSAWRGGLIVLAGVSLLHALIVRRHFWQNAVPAVRQAFLLAGALFFLVLVTSFLVDANPAGNPQFLTDFLLPFLLPILFVAHVGSEQRWRTVMFAMLFAGGLLLLKNLGQYVEEWQALGRLSPDIHLHRQFAVNLVFTFSLLFGAAQWVRSSIGRWALWVLIILCLLMIVGTGARGAWLGAVTVILVFLAGLRQRSILLGLFLGLVVVAFGLFWLVPPELGLQRIMQGLDSSGRVTGTWGPAIEMIGERPWLGYGFGDAIFHEQFNAKAAERANWTIKTSLGPHNFFLSLAFSAGLPALLAFFALLGVAGRAGLRCMQQLTDSPRDRALHISGLTIAAAFCGIYLTIGLVENLSWTLFGLSFGLWFAWLGRFEKASVK